MAAARRRQTLSLRLAGQKTPARPPVKRLRNHALSGIGGAGSVHIAGFHSEAAWFRADSTPRGTTPLASESLAGLVAVDLVMVAEQNCSPPIPATYAKGKAPVT